MERRVIRPGEWYWADKAVIQEYARKLGLLTVGVYHFLASMVDENQDCYPSQKYVAERIGCSRESVSRAVKRLVENKLISVWKTPGERKVYHLLPVTMFFKETKVSRKGTPDVSREDTNNNKGTRNKNNNVVGVKKSYPSDTTEVKPPEGSDREIKEKLLAHDLSEALDDRDHLSIYLSYAKKYPEPFLRRILSETRMTPESRIRKSRAALFRYLLNIYAE
ncbi:MAG TPA: helix-turn-helix domain-containing protein [Candidatus Acidoferrales bacterium]|nr:helix-turn-helix domain-containing protein [Candidatus Acidoferrales bacterium]